MIGWRKIVGCCVLAVEDKLESAWIDSCCINEINSAELSGGTNNIFRWYRKAHFLKNYSILLTSCELLTTEVCLRSRQLLKPCLNSKF
jgi:hypothetical protein